MISEIAEMFIRDVVLYVSNFWLEVRNLVAYEHHARMPVYVTPPLLYESEIALKRSCCIDVAKTIQVNVWLHCV